MFGIFSIFSDFVCLLLSVTASGSFPPPLSAAEEKEYFRLAREGDESARIKLIEHNLRLVAHIVRKYYSNSAVTGTPTDDLISIGCIGLIKAVDSFKTEAGARFATYGAKCIQNEILMYFRSQKKLTMEISINETIGMDHEGNPLTYTDVISCDDTIAEDLDTRIRTSKAIELLGSRLSEREKKIIVMRYGLTGSPPLPQREVAKLLGISRSYVSRIEKAALDKLKEAL